MTLQEFEADLKAILTVIQNAIKVTTPAIEMIDPAAASILEPIEKAVDVASTVETALEGTGETVSSHE